MENSIEKFSSASELRNAINQVKQLSWSINLFERQFPFQDIDESQIHQFVESYIAFGEELRSIFRRYQEVIDLNPTLKDIFKTKRNERVNEPQTGVD